MDNVGLLLNLSALVASCLAIVISIAFSLRQVNLTHRANQLPIVVQLFADMRSYGFVAKEMAIWREAPSIGPGVAVSQLPEPLREQVYTVGLFYSTVAYLVVLNAVDDQLATLPVHYRAVRTWDAIMPFVLEERAQFNSLHWTVLEAFILRLKEADIDGGVRKLHRRLTGRPR
jgi:hypothetical protein